MNWRQHVTAIGLCLYITVYQTDTGSYSTTEHLSQFPVKQCLPRHGRLSADANAVIATGDALSYDQTFQFLFTLSSCLLSPSASLLPYQQQSKSLGGSIFTDDA